MSDRWSTARSRDLGKELVRVRKAKGFSGSDMAKKLGWERSRVSRVERGEHGVEERDLVAWLTLCEVPRPELHCWTDLNREANQRTWFLPKGTILPGPALSPVSEESKAKSISTFESTLIPGLLQTTDYMAAISGDSSKVEALIAHRVARQQTLRGPHAPEVTFFIDEAALRRVVGSRAIMHDQLMRLMFMADWRKITIRVLLATAGAHAGMHGAFRLVVRKDKLKIVILDTKVANIAVEVPEHVKAYEHILTDLARKALNVDESRAFITALADEYGSENDESIAS